VTREQCQKCEGKGYRLDHAPENQHSKHDGSCITCPVTVVCDECKGKGHNGPMTREQEIQARLDAAQAKDLQLGPMRDGFQRITSRNTDDGQETYRTLFAECYDGEQPWPRARFILNAPDDLRYLLAENARLRQTVATFDYMKREGVTQEEALESWLDISSENARLREQVERVQAEVSDLRDLARSASSDSVTYGVSLSDLEDLFNLVAALGEGE